jgi:hypothetical protein
MNIDIDRNYSKCVGLFLDVDAGAAHRKLVVTASGIGGVPDAGSL